MRLLPVAAIACLGLTFALAGCYEETGSGNTQRATSYDDPVDAEAEPASSQPADDAAEEPRAYGNSRSTLGKARDSAKGTIGDLEERDRKLQKQIEDDRP